jgi:hypothetical protein
MIDYAANAILHWPAEALRGRFEARCMDPVRTRTKSSSRNWARRVRYRRLRGEGGCQPAGLADTNAVRRRPHPTDFEVFDEDANRHRRNNFGALKGAGDGRERDSEHYRKSTIPCGLTRKLVPPRQIGRRLSVRC